ASSRILEGRSTLCRGHTASAHSATASSSPRMPWKLTEAEGSVSLQRGARSALFAAGRAAVVGRGDELLVRWPSLRRGPSRRMEARAHTNERDRRLGAMSRVPGGRSLIDWQSGAL